MNYELNNETRKYFGLLPFKENWERVIFNELITLVFDENKIVKVIEYYSGYREFDTDRNTIDRKVLMPKTPRGKNQKMTISTVSKIRGTGISFSASFVGGGITVFDNRRNVFFIKSYFENNEIKTWKDIDYWIETFIKESPHDYFDWLALQMNSKRGHAQSKAGDFIAFNVSRFEYAFARIIFTDFFGMGFGGKPLLILPYSFISNTLKVNFNELIKKPTLNPIQINDASIYYGETPIVGFAELTELELSKIGPLKDSKYLGIPLTKDDILQIRNRW